MDITYHNHSCFKLKGKIGTVVMDPFAEDFGLKLSALSADLVTASHDHHDHNNLAKVAGTARRPKPFLITDPGEYEVGGISVFGMSTFHDATKGSERGKNTIFTVLIDDIRVCHLGDLGHELTSEQVEDIGEIDVLLCPVGGHFTIDPQQAVKVIQQLEPLYVIPMHFRTEKHNADFAQMATLEDFLKAYGMQPAAQPKLSVEKSRLPEETQLVVLSAV